MEIICSGLNVVDLLVATPNNVPYGQKTECKKIIVQGGAPAGNAASGLASLGHEVSFLGYLGDNTLSQIAKAELERLGVKTNHIKQKEGVMPAIAIVQIDEQGERTVLYSMNNYSAFEPNDVDLSIFDNCKLLLVDGYDTIINTYLLKEAKQRNITSVLDMETAPIEIMEEMVSLCSHAILPFEGAKTLSGKTAIEECLTTIQKNTEAQVVITDGTNGSFTIIDGQIINQPAFKVDVVDTTGCGDAFHAAYASAIVQKMNIRTAMKYASYFASRVATVFGGRTQFPTPTEMETFINK